MSPAPARNPFAPNWWARLGWVLLLAYCVYAVADMHITWARFLIGLHNGVRFVAEMFPPSPKRLGLLADNLVETVEIAVIASAFGIAASLPLGLAAARNLMPAWLTQIGRAHV